LEKIEVKSCAKINFGLRILEKRNDGFHNLQTLFIPIHGLFDTILFEKSLNNSFFCNTDFLSDPNSNMIIKAKSLLEKEFNTQLTSKIQLRKRIPIGAGLGGGSSNAAFTLLSLNELFSLNIPNDILQKLALKLGSDVPFFLNPIPAIGTSRGEMLEYINLPINFSIVIINPGIHISTKEAFLKVIPQKNTINYLSLINKGELDFNQCRLIVKNDFEENIFNKFPEIKKIKQKFYSLGSDFSLMSGTGSTVFGIFKNSAEAKNAITEFSSSYFGFILE
jgi:4-diphosphocytidyl-2-C-methyl-D-erythritol kinase